MRGRGGVGLLREGIRRAELLDAQARKPLSHIDTSLKGFTLDQARNKAAGKGVASTIGIDDLGGIDSVDGVLGNIGLTLDGNNSRFSTVGDDGDAGPLGVSLGEVGDGAGDGADVGGVG